ncbi:MAG: DnaD domain protein [Bacilli bacterium]|nr:DnaD domain protein [Bacilli bacterium]
MEKYTLLPADTYVVINKTILHDEDRKILTDLYLPIIGADAVMLYFCLWSSLDNSQIVSKDFSHQKLVSSLRMTINEIYDNRSKLEAIGLIKTLVKEGEVNNYIYELYSPASATEFLSHPILNIVLYSNIGKIEYDNLVKAYKLPRFNTSNYNDITKSFNDVFESTGMTSYDLSLDDIRKYNKLKLNINSNFDFNFLINSMPKNIDVNRVFTKEIKELIINLSFIYDIDAIHMSNIIKGCLNERGTINRELLRKSSRNYYQFDNGGILPTIIDNSQPEYLRKPVGDTSNRAKMIYTFETISPRELLIKKNNGSEPTRRDLKLLEDLLVDYKLKPGVVNVLIDYILNVNNKKLTRNYVETLAGEWQRLGIETVEEAMSTAEKEHKKRNKKVIKNENINVKTPDWFDKNITKNSISNDEENQLEELLKEYK